MNQGGSATSSSLNIPAGVSSDGTRLFIADTGNNRTLIFNSSPAANGAAASTVIGQADFVSTATNQGGASPTDQTENGPTGVYGNGTALFIADSLNNRVLIFNSLPATNDAVADEELGQPDFVSMAPNQDTAANFMEDPESIMVDSAGRLILSDFTNNRVLIFNSVPATNGAPANVVVGQPNFTSTNLGLSANSLYTPYGAYSDGTRLYVSDTSNNRVLIFSPIPTSNGAAASTVLGQGDFISGTANQGSGAAVPPVSGFQGIYGATALEPP